jgi:hypothetical protein
MLIPAIENSSTSGILTRQNMGFAEAMFNSDHAHACAHIFGSSQHHWQRAGNLFKS